MFSKTSIQFFLALFLCYLAVFEPHQFTLMVTNGFDWVTNQFIWVDDLFNWVVNWVIGWEEKGSFLSLLVASSIGVFLYFRLNWRYRGAFQFVSRKEKLERKKSYGTNEPGIWHSVGYHLLFALMSFGIGYTITSGIFHFY